MTTADFSLGQRVRVRKYHWIPENCRPLGIITRITYTTAWADITVALDHRYDAGSSYFSFNPQSLRPEAYYFLYDT